MEILEKPECNCLNLSKDNKNYFLSYENENFKVYGELFKGSTIILKYCGKLLETNNNENSSIFMHYGFGSLWQNKGNIEMSLCKHSDLKHYCTVLNLPSSESLMFCFMDDNNNWDLNNNSSYELKISEKPLDLSKKEEEIVTTDEDFLNGFQKFIKKLTDGIYNVILKIGNGFEKNNNLK
jgi:hypothetical protein